MSADISFIISYALNGIACLLAAGLLLFLKPLHQATNRKYRIARWILAGAAAIVGSGHLATLLFHNSPISSMGMFASVIMLISASQSLMFTFLLIVLFREKYVTKKNIWKHAMPSLVLFSLYLISLFIWEDVSVYSWPEWWSQLGSHPPVLIRSLFGGVYLAQLPVYTFVFFRERGVYQQELDALEQVPETLEMRWVTRAFWSALGIGVLAFTLFFILSLEYEVIVTSVFSVYYLAIAICYINYFYVYDTLRNGLIKGGAVTEDGVEKENLDLLLAGLVQVQKQTAGKTLYTRAEELMCGESPFLDPSFNRNRLAQALYTNERYLADAIQEATGLSIQYYITRYRLNHACSELLLPADCRTIEQIAFDSGFSSQRTFNRLFREIKGMTPGEFRKNETGKVSR